jgi:hypothetical protein
VQREEYLDEPLQPLRIEKWVARRRGRPEPQPRRRPRVLTVLVDQAGGRYALSEVSSWGTPAILQALDVARVRADDLEELYAQGGISMSDAGQLLFSFAPIDKPPPPPALGPGTFDPFDV